MYTCTAHRTTIGPYDTMRSYRHSGLYSPPSLAHTSKRVRTHASSSTTTTTTATTTPTIPPPKPRHVCVAADGTEPSLHALEWVVTYLISPSHQNTVVHLAHVVCDTRTPQMAVDALGTSGGHWSPQVIEQQQLAEEWRQRLVEQGRQLIMQRFVPVVRRAGGIAYEIDVLRQRGAKSAAGIGELLCAKSSNMWALVVASHGAGVLADYGSVAQYCVQHSTVPLVLLPPTMVDDTANTAHTAHDVDCLIISFGSLEHLAAGVSFAVDVMGDDKQQDGTSRAVSSVLVVDEKEDDDNINDTVSSVVKEHARGLKVQHVTTLPYQDDGSSMRDDGDEGHVESALGAQLCAMANECKARMVIVHGLHGGLVQELMYGAALLHVLRHCGRPVVLL